MEETFKPGDKITVVGFYYNGQIGTVVDFDLLENKYKVDLYAFGKYKYFSASELKRRYTVIEKVVKYFKNVLYGNKR